MFFIFWMGLYSVNMFLGTRHLKNYEDPIPYSTKYWFDKFLCQFDWVFDFRLTDIFNFCLGFPIIKVKGDNTVSFEYLAEFTLVFVAKMVQTNGIFIALDEI
jgi:hypothetical protein